MKKINIATGKGSSTQFQLGIEYCDSSFEWIPVEGIDNASTMFAMYRQMVGNLNLISLSIVNDKGAVVKKYSKRSW